MGRGHEHPYRLPSVRCHAGGDPVILELLPSMGLPGLAFDDACVESYVFYLRFPSGPAAVTVEWYPDVADRGYAVWGARVVPIAPGEVVDVPRPDGWGFPMLTVPDRYPGDSVTLKVDFGENEEHAALVLYRDAANPQDTMVGDAVVTGVHVRPVASVAAQEVAR